MGISLIDLAVHKPSLKAIQNDGVALYYTEVDLGAGGGGGGNRTKRELRHRLNVLQLTPTSG
jgi:hypothetical protein